MNDYSKHLSVEFITLLTKTLFINIVKNKPIQKIERMKLVTKFISTK